MKSLDGLTWNYPLTSSIGKTIRLAKLLYNQIVVYRIVPCIQLKLQFGLLFDVLELLPGETNIFEITNSNVWQENQIGQLNTAIWSTIRLQPCYLYLSICACRSASSGLSINQFISFFA